MLVFCRHHCRTRRWAQIWKSAALSHLGKSPSFCQPCLSPSQTGDSNSEICSEASRKEYIWKSFVISKASCKMCDLFIKVSLVAQMVKNLSAMQETQVWFLGCEDSLEKGLETHSSILEKSMDRGTWLFLFVFFFFNETTLNVEKSCLSRES